jgi:uncharacterized sulfatase
MVSMQSPPISRRLFVESSVAAVAAPMIKAAPEPKRNVLFIASDDLNTTIGCYGHPIIRTPNIDRLARSGVHFGQNYCQYPLCNPSRSSLMTGMAPDTTRVVNNATHFREALSKVETLPQVFQKNGYFAARAGKIYHYGNPDQIGTNGLDDAPSWNERVNPAGIDHKAEEPMLINYTPDRGLGSAICFHSSEAKDNEHTDYLVADTIIGMMDKHRKEPWFLGAGFYKPHVPWIAPSKYFDLYPLSGIQALPFDESEMHIAPEWAYFTKPANWNMTVAQRRDAIRSYYACISFLDAQIGRLLDALEHFGLAQNTLIVMWADHGYQLGEHGQWMKQTLFEPATHVPLLMGGAGVATRGGECRRITEHLDIYPTVVELCGLSGAPSNLQGRSLGPLLKNPSATWDQPAVSQVHRAGGGKQVMGYSLRTERYRYTFWNQGTEGEELYDYQKDPRELHNLAGDKASDALKGKLRTSLESITQARGMAG